MCQARIYLTSGGKEEMVAQDVIALEETPEGVRFSTFFEEPKTLRARVTAIDFLKHTVLIAPLDEEAGSGDRPG